MSLDNIFKSFSSLLDSNNGHDPNLYQGKELLDYEGMYKKLVLPHLKPLQMTSSPNLSSLVVETLDSESSVNSKQQASNEKMSKLEQEFNQKLSEYSAAYKTLMESLINNTKDKNSVVKYYGKVVKDKEGNYVYINDYGFTHKYLSDAWSYNDVSCPNSVSNIYDDNFNKLTAGPNMGSGQACKIAGQNIKNTTTKEIAWVDIKGFKHIYPKDIWDNKKKSCDVVPIELSSKAYDNIPTGTPMEKNVDCLKINVDTMLWSKIQLLNEELISIASKLSQELSNMVTKDNNINQEIQKKQKMLDKYVDELNNNKGNINFIEKDYTNAQGQEIFSKSYAESNQYQKTIWFILALLLIFGLFRSLDGADDRIASTILIVALVFVLYFVMKTYWV